MFFSPFSHSTFILVSFWFQNPNIVLVHYLNLPDKSSSRDNLVNSLLQYRDMHDQELLNQLQPICKFIFIFLLLCKSQLHEQSAVSPSQGRRETTLIGGGGGSLNRSLNRPNMLIL